MALPEGATVGELANNHQELLHDVSSDILKIQYSIIGQHLDSSALMESMSSAFNGDLNHKCMGRSAPTRLKRAIETALKAKVATPALSKIASLSDHF